MVAAPPELIERKTSLNCCAGPGLYREILDLVVELRDPLDRLRRHQKFAGARPALHQHDVDFGIRQPPPLGLHPRHRLPIRYVGDRWKFDPVEYLLELYSALDRNGIAQHRRYFRDIEEAREPRRVAERSTLLLVFRTAWIQSVGPGVGREHVRHPSVDVIRRLDEAA